MSEDRKVRVKKLLTQLEGVDAAPHIRGMAREIAQTVAEGRRKAEVDGEQRVTDIMDVDVMAFEDKNGFWKVEAMSQDIFPGQNGLFFCVDRTERLAIAEFRARLAHEMITCRFCRQEQALKLAYKANVRVQARVPFVRIQTTVA